MNEIILIGKVLPRVKYFRKNNISVVYLNVDDDSSNTKYNYIPIIFRNINHKFVLSLKGKEIAISGHIESSTFNKIFVDVFKVIN